MEHLKTLLSKTFQATWKIKLLSDWPHIMGNLSNAVSIEKMYDDTLVVGVSNACLLQELYLLSPVLITTINEHLDIPRIKTLRFKHLTRVEKISHTPHQEPLPIEKKNYRLRSCEQQALQNIKDSELKSALQSFLERCQQEKTRM